jgi:hypothetical protein
LRKAVQAFSLHQLSGPKHKRRRAPNHVRTPA